MFIDIGAMFSMFPSGGGDKFAKPSATQSGLNSTTIESEVEEQLNN